MSPFSFLCVVILLPIIPAIILFKALPTSKGDVSGKLQGLEIKLSGAFAGYFAVVVLVLVNHTILIPPIPVPPPPPPTYEMWYVTGQVTDEDGPIDPLDITKIYVSPASIQPDPAPGSFSLKAYSLPGPDGKFIYPTLTFSPNPSMYLPASEISLDPSKPQPAGAPWTVTFNGQQVTVNVKLKKLNPYSAGAPMNSPAGGNATSGGSDGPK
jgi:hypothetical protein